MARAEPGTWNLGCCYGMKSRVCAPRVGRGRTPDDISAKPPMSSGRERKQRQLYDPTPVSGSALRAALEAGCQNGRALSDVTEEEAAAALKQKRKAAAETVAAEEAAKRAAVALEAATPRELPFSQPPRERPEASLLLTCSPMELQQAELSPATTFGPPSTRKKNKIREPFSVRDDDLLSGFDPSLSVNVVSEFSGIGAFEHGMQAGFDEAVSLLSNQAHTLSCLRVYTCLSYQPPATPLLLARRV